MDYNYYTLWYHSTAIFGYMLVAGMAFIAGWVIRDTKAKRKVKEIDGFALYKVAMRRKEESAKIKVKQEKEARRRKLFRVFKG